jgi:flagellar hook-associated protein 1 FlgK
MSIINAQLRTGTNLWRDGAGGRQNAYKYFKKSIARGGRQALKPTFLGYYIARSGIDAARANLQITGQNMTNANTSGYSRQRVDLCTVGTSGYNALYMLHNDADMVEGVKIGGISQIRDPYLDVHYRMEICKVGDKATQLDALGDLENIFDETTEDGLMAQFSDLKSQLETLAGNAGDSVKEKVVQTSALMLAKMFNQYAEQIQVAKDRQLSDFEDGGIANVNQLLESIAYLNEEIKNAGVVGDPALELKDRRNVMLDDLAEFMNIEVKAKTAKINENTTTETISVLLVGANGEKFTLVDGGECRQLELSKNTDETVSVSLLNVSGNYVGSSDSNDLQLANGDITQQFTSGSFGGYLTMINSAGEFDSPATAEKGIPYYGNMLDVLAGAFAEIFNQANSTNETPPYDKPLFGTADGSGVITAKNIALSEKWKNATDTYITGTKEPAQSGTGETQSSDNILYMVSLFSKDFDFITPAAPRFSAEPSRIMWPISAIRSRWKLKTSTANMKPIPTTRRALMNQEHPYRA